MAELNWTELINDIMQSVKLYSTHLGPIMGHRFRSLSWGFWIYSAALLSRILKNEAYTDGLWHKNSYKNVSIFLYRRGNFEKIFRKGYVWLSWMWALR